MGLADLLLRPVRSPVVTSAYPSSRDLPDRGHRGTPSPGSVPGASEWDAAGACPVAAITTSDRPGSMRALAIDYGKCLFCGNCVQACPAGELRSGNEFELAGRTRESVKTAWSLARDGAFEPPAATGDAPDHAATRGLRRSLHIRHLDSGSCNGCDWEMTALLNPVYDIQRLGIDFVASPRHADLLLVSGAMTRNLMQAARLTYEAMPEPRRVVAAGACAISGGPFVDSYATAGGADTVLPVDVFVPGCPPRPEALIHGILLAVGRRAGGRSGDSVTVRPGRG